MKSIVESPYCVTWLENDILHHVYKPNLIIDLDTAKKLVAHRLEVTAGVTRPILVDIQALVNPTNFGYPKRTASGFDLNRLNLLIAALVGVL
jgi:DNA repair protein RadA/Sms